MVLDEIKKWMNLIGWQNGGEPGDIKKDDSGTILARQGDPVWIEDVQDCCEKATAAAACIELMRRAELKTSNRT